MEHATTTCRVIFIGGGNLAQAIFAKLSMPNIQIVVVQRNLVKLANLQQQYVHIEFIRELNFTATASDLIILAIKPQDAKTACMLVKQYIQRAIVVSVMAGIKTTTLATWLDNNKLVRVMPNVLSGLGYGISGIYFTDKITSSDKLNIENIFSSIGKNYILATEEYIDKITATSASSPAYIIYFLECMVNSAIKLGFNKSDALDMTLQVVKGSLALITSAKGVSLEQLRGLITSKKGTTEAAINALQHAKLSEIIYNAELACINRAEQLSKENGTNN